MATPAPPNAEQAGQDFATVVPPVSTNVPYNPAAANAAQIDMGQLAKPDAALVQDQLAGILNKGGPLMQQAMTTGNQAAAGRGLLNSSLGISAAQSAMTAAAMPIAQSDAAALNQVALTNAGATNSALQSNANFTQQAGSQTSQQQQQAMLAEAQARADAEKFNSSQAQQNEQFNAQQGNAMHQFNTAQVNESIRQNMDVASRQQLADTESAYKNLMQVNSSASGVYEQVMKNVSDIQNNKDITDKQGYIDSQMQYLRNALGMIQSINGINGLITY